MLEEQILPRDDNLREEFSETDTSEGRMEMSPASFDVSVHPHARKHSSV